MYCPRGCLPRHPAAAYLILVRPMRAIVLVALSLALAGCDPAYGVWRQAYVGHIPDSSKVRAIVQHTPGIDKVTYRHYQGGFPSSPKTISITAAVHTCAASCDSGSIRANAYSTRRL